MKKYVCEMCGKKVLQIQEHHIIPWHFSHDDSSSNVMALCPSCHGKADHCFINLIMYGKMNISNEANKRSATRYKKKYRRRKLLFHFRLLKNTYYHDRLVYNTKTENISINSCWLCKPYKYRDRMIKSL